MLLNLRVFQFSAVFSAPKPQKKAFFPKVVPVTASVRSSPMGSASYATSSALLFRQMFEKESCTYTYLLADASHPDRPALVSSHHILVSYCLNLRFTFILFIRLALSYLSDGQVGSEFFYVCLTNFDVV